MISTALQRCDWCLHHPLMQSYHDQEWGLPIHDDQKLFEFLTLEGAQAGLSWLTVLKRREGYRHAFDQFNAAKIVHYTPPKMAALMKDSNIIRHRLKIESVIKNAHAFLALQEKYNGFNQYIWQFVEGTPIKNSWKKMGEQPARTTVSDCMSKDLKQNGFSFVGSTICYAYMQAVGMVNDHWVKCFRYQEV